MLVRPHNVTKQTLHDLHPGAAMAPDADDHEFDPLLTNAVTLRFQLADGHDYLSNETGAYDLDLSPYVPSVVFTP